MATEAELVPPDGMNNNAFAVPQFSFEPPTTSMVSNDWTRLKSFNTRLFDGLRSKIELPSTLLSAEFRKLLEIQVRYQNISSAIKATTAIPDYCTGFSYAPIVG